MIKYSSVLLLSETIEYNKLLFCYPNDSRTFGFLFKYYCFPTIVSFIIILT